MTVIVLLGILALGAAGPTMNYVGQMRRSAAAQRITSDVRLMQRMAIHSGYKTWIAFDVAANSYRLYAEDPANPGKANRLPVLHPSEQSTGPVLLNSGTFTGVTLSSVNIAGTTELEFNNFGAPYDGNSAVLTSNAVITLSGGTTITVRPVSGFVERS